MYTLPMYVFQLQLRKEGKYNIILTITKTQIKYLRKASFCVQIKYNIKKKHEKKT